MSESYAAACKKFPSGYGSVTPPHPVTKFHKEGLKERLFMFDV